jgi:hypothetical protein
MLSRLCWYAARRTLPGNWPAYPFWSTNPSKKLPANAWDTSYELVLGEKLDKRNFRRRILQAGVIEPTQQSRSGEGRPARLYRYRPDAADEVQARRLFP